MTARTRPPRMFAALWFIKAAAVVAAGFLLRALGWSTAMGLEPGSEMMVASLASALFVGIGIGEWRGISYAERLVKETRPAP